jgi:hypothetical protein
MKKSKQEEILNKYHKIFAQFTWSPSQTAMCWGLECGDGWLPLIDALCNDIQKYIDITDVPQIEVTQVKQKFGGLRFYYRPYEKEIDKMIWAACEHSTNTCEECGSTDNVTMTKGWISPKCEDCMRKYKRQK